MTTPYSNYFCGNVEDLKHVHPGMGLPISAVIFGPTYPLVEAVRFYVWDWFSTDTPDDVEIIKPYAEPYEPMENGRWIRVDIDGVVPQVNADWTANTGPSAILHKPTLAAVATSGVYSDLLGKPTIPAAQVNSDWNASSGVTQVLNKPSFANVAFSGNYNDLSNKPTAVSNSSSLAVRSLNTAFQVSATRGAFVSYSVKITVTASIAGGQDGDVILEIANDSGFTTGVQQVSIIGLGQTYTLAVAIQGVQPQTGVLTGYVPAGSWARLRTVNNTGTPTFAYRTGQETLV